MSRCLMILAAFALILTGHADAQPDKGDKADTKPSLVVKVESAGLPQHARQRLGKLGGFRYAGVFSTATMSPDGKFLAVVGQNGDAITIVDIAAGKAVQTLQTRIFGGIGGGVSFSPDGSTIAIQTFQDLKVWDVASGKQLQAIQHRDNASRGYGPSLSKDGKIVGIGSEKFAAKDQTGEVKAFETATGKAMGPFATLHNYNIRVTMAPDGKTMASWGNHLSRGAGMNDRDAPKTIQIWDLAAGKELRQIKLDFGPQGFGQVSNVTYSPDGKTMAVVSGGSTFHLLEADTGKETRRFAGVRGQGGVNNLRFSPDGETLAAYDNFSGHLQAWEVKSGKRLDLVDGPKSSVLGVAFPGKGKVVALANVAGALFWWDATVAEDASPFAGHLTSISALAYTPDGKTLLSAGADQQLIYWDPETGKERQRQRLHDDDGARYYGGPGMRTSFAISPNAKYAATMSDYNNGLRLWNLKTGRPVADFEAQRTFGAGGLAFSPDSTRLASTGAQSPLALWDITTGQELPKMPGNVQARNINVNSARIAFSPDGKTVASHVNFYDLNGRPSTDLILWDIANKKELHRASIALPNVGIVNSGSGGMLFSNDGRFLALSDASGSVALLYANNGKEAMRLVTKNKNASHQLAFSADGRFLAIGSLPYNFNVNVGIGGRNDPVEDPIIEIWELASGAIRDTYKGHTGGITCLAFSPDGATLASGSMDTTVLLWDFAGKHAAKQPLAQNEMLPAWKSLEGKDPQLAVTIRRLIQTPETIAFLKQNLTPVKDQSIDEKTLEKLVAELGSGTFKTRDAATRELKRLGERADAALKKAMAGDTASVEARRRMQELLDGMVRKTVTPEELQAIRGIEILERIGSAEAREHLTALSKGDPVSPATVAAGRALKRMTTK